MTTRESLEVSAPADRREVEEFGRILTQSLFFPPLEEFDWIAAQGAENIRLVRQGGEVAGGLGFVRMGQWFGGKSVPMAGVRPVGVAPEYRSSGAATVLLRKAPNEFHQDGFPLSGLYPATQPVYRRAGYEQGGNKTRYKMPLAAIDVRDRTLGMRRATEEDHELIRELYTRRAQQTSGNLDREQLLWNRVLRPQRGTAYAYLVTRGDEAEGYVVYVQERVPNTFNADMYLLDVVALSADAGRRILTFLADHRSVVENVIWNGAPAEPLFYLVANQSHKVEEYWKWMLRVVDVRSALEGRGYAPGVEAEVRLEVHDDVLPWNAGRWVLEVSGGEGRVREGGDGGLRLDVRGLASLYTGHLSPYELQATGLLEAWDPRDLASAALIFAGPTPWMPDMY